MFLPNPTTLGMRTFPLGVRKVPSDRSSSQTHLEKTRNHEETPNVCHLQGRSRGLGLHMWSSWRCSMRHFCLMAPWYPGQALAHQSCQAHSHPDPPNLWMLLTSLWEDRAQFDLRHWIYGSLYIVTPSGAPFLQPGAHLTKDDRKWWTHCPQNTSQRKGSYSK